MGIFFHLKLIMLKKIQTLVSTPFSLNSYVIWAGPKISESVLLFIKFQTKNI